MTTARSQASAMYFPIVMGINVVYILLCFGMVGVESLMNVWSLLGMVAVWGLQYLAYGGIMDNAANRKPNDKTLVGGSSLDLLGLTVVVQFGAVLWSPRLYWLLGGVPIWYAYSLYSTFAGGGAKAGGVAPTTSQSAEPSEEEQELAARRQKRAERRQQKRH